MDKALLDESLKAVKILVLDCDGVLTNGQMLLNGTDSPLISMSARDGLGIKMLQRSGVRVAVISGRYSEALAKRAEVLGLLDCITNRLDKGVALNELLTKHGFKASEAAYMGDDLPDLAAFKVAQLTFCPADGEDEVKAAADYVTSRPGGFGAVREVCNLILKSQGHWDEITSIIAKVHSHDGKEPR